LKPLSFVVAAATPRSSEVLLMDVTERDDIFAGDTGEMFLRAMAGGDQGEV
jgi:hypothetical protein